MSKIEAIKTGCYDALVIKGHWLDKIFDENDPKDWEIRGCRTNKRGKIFLAQSGTGMIMGETNLVDCIELDLVDFKTGEIHHKIHEGFHHGKLPYTNTYAWVFKDSVRYDKPIPYDHPQGAVIWVKIPIATIEERKERCL